MHHQSLQNVFEEPLSIWQWFCIGVITILYNKSIFVRLNEKSPPLLFCRIQNRALLFSPEHSA
jgi:hypothetical protein